VIDPREAIQIEYRREIREVKLESDTRARVECIIQNVTPLEYLKESLTPEEKSQRIRGKDFVYIMGKFQDGWKIVDKGPRSLRDPNRDKTWDILELVEVNSVLHNKGDHGAYYYVYNWEN
jgi:hypothetical protein